MRKSNPKKTLITVVCCLVGTAILATGGIIASNAIVGGRHKVNTTATSTAISVTTSESSAAATKATEKATTEPTVKPTQASAEKTATETTQTTSEVSTASNNTSTNTPVMPNLIGLWGNLDNGGCCILITNQDGNRIDFTIESSNYTGTKIATADISVTLDTCYEENGIGGTSGFRYCDSFGNSGTGSIIISGNLINLTICEEYNSSSGWTIGNTTGTYIRV